MCEHLAPQHMESGLKNMATSSDHEYDLLTLLAIWHLFWGGCQSHCDMTELVWPHATLIYAVYRHLVSHVRFWAASYIFHLAWFCIVAWLTDPVLKSLSVGGKICGESTLSCPCHCSASYIMSHVSCRAHDMLPVYPYGSILCDVPAGLLHWTIAWLTVPVWCMCLYLLGHILWPEGLVTLILMTIMSMQLLCGLYIYDFAHAHSTMSCIPLVYCINTVAGCAYRYRIVHDCQYQYIAVYVDLTITLIFVISHG